MEIIESLEPTRRALYAGTVGYVDASGDMDMAIAIRTAVLHQGRAYVQAGAGIVADSDPATEEAETRHKARAVLSAIATAEGLRELPVSSRTTAARRGAGAPAGRRGVGAPPARSRCSPAARPGREVTAERAGAAAPGQRASLTGADAAPLVPAAGLVLLAAAVALLAVRGLGRAAVGLLMAVAGGVLAWSGVRALAGGLDAAAAQEFAGTARPRSPPRGRCWPSSPGSSASAAGVLAVLRGRAWPAMGRRYERTATQPATTARRPETDEDRAQAAWQALDRGEDPTDGDPATDP